MITTEMMIGLAIGLGLSACCGFRVFIPLLVSSVAAKMGWLPLAQNFTWLSSWGAIVCFATASLAEILAYYIPVVDNFLDTIATPSAMIAGTVISASTLIHLDPTWQWILGMMVGGGSAGLIQAGTGLTRLGSTKLTAGTANPILSTVENIFAIGGSIAALLAPLFMAIMVIVLLTLIIYAVAKFLFKKKAKTQIH